MRRWVPKAMADDPVYVFETGGTTGIPKSRVALNDFRTDYELFSASLPDEHFPPGSNWLIAGGPPARAACAWRWSISASTAAASASAWTSIPDG